MEVLAAMLEATKHNGKRHNLTLEEAFEDIIKGSYKYSKGWYEDTYNKNIIHVSSTKIFYIILSKKTY